MATTEIKSLLHFDESATKDECYKAVWTLGENATLSSAQKKFGSSSLYFPTADSFIKGTDENIFKIIPKSGGYYYVREFEFWMWFDESITSFSPLKIKYHSYGSSYTGSLIFSKIDDKWVVDYFGNELSKSDNTGYTYGSGYPCKTTYVFENSSYNSWHHVFLRYTFPGDTIYIFIDGEFKLHVDVDSSYYRGTTGIQLGGFVGYIDEFVYRVIKVDGDVTVNLYTNDPNSMTVPTSPYVYVASEAEKAAYENRFKTTPYTDDEDFTENFDVPGVIQLRGGTKAVLAAVNPILARREIMVEVDTGQMKIGTGTRRWNNLKYVGDF